MLDNKAYDYELFQPKKERVAEQPEVKALPKSNKKLEQRKSIITNSALKRYGIVFAAAIVLLGGFIFAKSHYYELSREYADCNRELNELHSENVCLQVTYESNLSVDSIEEYAIDVLGMQVPDANQIKYITLANEDHYEFMSKSTRASFVSPLLFNR